MSRIIAFLCIAPLALIGAGIVLHVLLILMQFAFFQ
jgi:hypothetical protein